MGDQPSKKIKPKPKDDSDSGSSEDEDKQTSKKMDVDDDDSDSVAEEAPKKSESVKKPKKAGSDSDSDSSSDSEAPSKKEEKPASKKEESENSSDSGSEDEKPKPKKEKAKAKADSDDSSSDESSSEEDKPEEKKEDDSDSSSDSEKGKSPPATPNKRKSPFGDGSPAKKGRPEGQSKFGGAKTELKGTTQRVFVGNLSYDIDDEKCKEFFKEVGELTDIFWLTDRESGDFKGCGFLSFATAEMADKAVEQMAGKELMGRPLKIDWAEERKGGKKKGGRVPDGVNNPLSERPDNCYSVFLGNLDFNITEDDVKKHFKECGELKNIRWMQKDGEFKGAGFVEFETTEAVDKAVKLCGKEIIGRAARVDYAKPRAPR